MDIYNAITEVQDYESKVLNSYYSLTQNTATLFKAVDKIMSFLTVFSEKMIEHAEFSMDICEEMDLPMCDHAEQCVDYWNTVNRILGYETEDTDRSYSEYDYGGYDWHSNSWHTSNWTTQREYGKYKSFTVKKVVGIESLETQHLDQKIYLSEKILGLIKTLEENHKGLEFGFLLHYDKKEVDNVLNVYVKDYTIVPARIHQAETQLVEQMTTYQDNEFIDKITQSDYVGYLHSHNSMGAFHSGQDDTTFYEESKIKEDILSIVCNYKGEYDTKIYHNNKLLKGQTVYVKSNNDIEVTEKTTQDAIKFAEWLELVSIRDWVKEVNSVEDDNELNSFIETLQPFELKMYNLFKQLKPKSMKQIPALEEIKDIMKKYNV